MACRRFREAAGLRNPRRSRARGARGPREGPGVGPRKSPEAPAARRCPMTRSGCPRRTSGTRTRPGRNPPGVRASARPPAIFSARGRPPPRAPAARPASSTAADRGRGDPSRCFFGRVPAPDSIPRVAWPCSRQCRASRVGKKTLASRRKRLTFFKDVFRRKNATSDAYQNTVNNVLEKISRQPAKKGTQLCDIFRFFHTCPICINRRDALSEEIS